jgi:hypothetical protein
MLEVKERRDAAVVAELAQARPPGGGCRTTIAVEAS